MQTDSTASATAEQVADQVRCLIPAPQVAARVQELAAEISADYADKSLLVVGVLHGAYVFMADLVRQLKIPIRCGFVMVSSYGDDMVSSGQVKLRLDVTQPVEGEHVLLIDDIVDTGISVNWLIDRIKRQGAASLRLCALLDKSARRRVPVEIDYLGFEIPNQFVVGYGIDWAGRHRELPYVGYVPTGE